MIDPPRLLDGELRPVEQALLRAAEEDAPSAAARASARAALGLDAPVAAATAAGSSVGWTVAVGGVVALAAALWVGIAMLSVGPVSPPNPVVAAAPVAVVVPTPTPTPAPPRFEALAPELLVGPPTAPAPARVAKARPAVRRPRPSPAAPVGGSIAEELRLLDRAREALGHGESKVALRTLHAYRARFPAGALAPEGEVLTVKAYLEAGRLASARRALRRLRGLSPDHPALPELVRELEAR